MGPFSLLLASPLFLFLHFSALGALPHRIFPSLSRRVGITTQNIFPVTLFPRPSVSLSLSIFSRSAPPLGGGQNFCERRLSINAPSIPYGSNSSLGLPSSSLFYVIVTFRSGIFLSYPLPPQGGDFSSPRFLPRGPLFLFETHAPGSLGLFYLSSVPATFFSSHPGQAPK